MAEMLGKECACVCCGTKEFIRAVPFHWKHGSPMVAIILMCEVCMELPVGIKMLVLGEEEILNPTLH